MPSEQTAETRRNAWGARKLGLMRGAVFVAEPTEAKLASPLPPRKRREADVCYMVAPERRGQGLASRALVALIARGMREPGLHRVNLACHIDNTASQRVAEKSGFTFIGRDGDELRFRRETMPA